MFKQFYALSSAKRFTISRGTSHITQICCDLTVDDSYIMRTRNKQTACCLWNQPGSNTSCGRSLRTARDAMVISACSSGALMETDRGLHAAHVADSKHADMLTVIWPESPKIADRSKYVHVVGRITLIYIIKKQGPSRWPRGLGRSSAPARFLRLRFRIPPGTWMSVSCKCCVMSGRGLCGEPIPSPEEPYRVSVSLGVIKGSNKLLPYNQ